MLLKDYAHAQPQLERAALLSENLGLKPLLMKSRFLLGQLWREQARMAEAIPQYQKALDLLDSFRKDAGAEKILERADFKSIYNEADHAVHPHS